MSSFVVSTAFRTKDEMSRTFKRMGLSGNSFANKLIRNFNRIDRKVLSTRRIIGGILGAAAVQRGLGLLAQGVRGVTNEFLDFEDAITAASAKFGIFDRKSPAFKALGETAREVGATTEFTSSQAAEGLRFLAKAGWEANSALKALPSFVDLATASEMEFSRAADIATDVMGAFRLKSSDATENLKQLVRVNDVLSKAVNMSNIDMEDLFETIKFAGPIAKTAGVSLEDFSAMAAFVGGAGIKGSMGGTALRTMFLNLVAPTDSIKGKLAEFNTEIKNVKHLKANRKALAKLGIVLDETGKLTPIKTLQVMNERMKKLSPSARAAALNIIFGKRAVSASSVAMDGASGALQKFQKDLKGASGTSKKMAKFMRGSLSKRFAELKSAAIELGFKFIDTFEKKVPGGIDAAIKAIREFDIKPVIKTVKDAIEVTGELLTILRDYKGVLVGVAAGFAAIKIGGFITSIWGAVTAMKALSVAGGGFLAVSGALLGTVAVVAIAIGGLAAGVYTLITYWDDLTQSVKLFAMDALKWMDRIVNHKIFGHDAGFFDEDTGQRISLRAAAKTEGNVMPTVDDLAKSASQGAGAPGNTDKIARASVKAMLGDQRMPTSLELAQNAARTDKILRDLESIKQRHKKAPGSAPLAAPGALAPPAQDKRLKAGDKDKSVAPQAIKFEGRFDFAGAPEGSKVSSKTRGAPPVRMNMLGQN